MGFLDSMFGGGVAKEARRAKKEARRVETERQDRITRGRADIERIFGTTYTPEFYAGVEKDYRDWAMPQLNRQSEEVTRNMLYALSRAGLTRSSAKSRGMGDIQMDFDTQRQNVAKTAMDLANQRRSQVEGQRQGIESQLYAATDPAAAAQAANNAARNYSFAPEYSPMGQILQDVSAAYGMSKQNPGFVQQAAQNRGGSSSGFSVRG